MSYTIYLYGAGASSTGREDNCYLKCAIPTVEYSPVSGLMPSLLHSYIMYAKDIGLLVTDVIYEGFSSDDDKRLLDTQTPYSLWPLFYVNNSSVFTEGEARGVALWTKSGNELTYVESIRLQTELAYYYRKDLKITAQLDMDVATKASNPLPTPNSIVNADASWFLDLTIPDEKDAASDASTYAIVKHYNKLVIVDTLSDMDKIIEERKSFDGLKAATGKTLKDIVDRPHSYDALMPAWESVWGEDNKPGWYDKMRLSMNSYNISASLFLYKDKDPDKPDAALQLFATASNIKGVIKSGHAETRLLLTLDAINYAKTRSEWFRGVYAYYDFDISKINIDKITSVLKGKNIALISSLKPCYLCVGEVDATTDGFILFIDGAEVNMFAAFADSSINTSLKKVIYFDIDQPIVYPGTINVTVNIDKFEYVWSLSLCPWVEWTASANLQKTIKSFYNSPIGPRIVEPAGECLKTGYSYIRYRNSAEILLKSDKDYFDRFQKLTSTIVIENEVER